VFGTVAGIQEVTAALIAAGVRDAVGRSRTELPIPDASNSQW
jgi:hypothetical protein